LDKGKAAAVTTIMETRDKHTGALIFENQSTVFIRGSGGFGGKRVGKDRGAATAPNVIPNRAPDAVLEEKTVPTQAALYRLSGDTNPLHISSYFHSIETFLSTDHLRFFLNSLRWVDSTSRSCMGFARWAYLANIYSRRSVLSKTSKFDLQASFTQAKP